MSNTSRFLSAFLCCLNLDDSDTVQDTCGVMCGRGANFTLQSHPTSATARLKVPFARHRILFVDSVVYRERVKFIRCV